ncbi:MAG TPA: tetratricopeptide repeat protein [Candidatus Limnocylindrales bacterium]|nr:tetratricopeptide repeat protein [Candidatus Limnocylindrales bacterium]
MKQRPNKSKAGRKSVKTPSAPTIPLSQRRKWLFRFIALVVMPLLLTVLLVALVEIALRIGGYGYDTSFFRSIRVGGQEYFLNNEKFSQRFFPPQLARWPDPFIFPATKPPDTVRIFIFGESAAMGDPQPAYGASRYLEVLLRQRFPGKKIEVINLGITAINSHVILPIARECARHDGDFWIVYMGNNEMIGPYGAATVFGAQALPRRAAQFNLAIQQTRTGQLLVSGLRNLGGKSKNTSWGGMEMFLENRIAPDDPRKETVYRNFGANLRDIVAAGVNSGAKVILNTVSVNLKDCPPFASLTNSHLPAADRQHLDQIFAEAKSLQTQSNFLTAIELFTQATQLEPQFAEAHFRLAQCELELTNAAVQAQFQIACDDDALPFRADTRINSAIRQVAQQRASDRLVLCDAEQALAQASPSRISGDETFYEHVHFNLDGNYRLGKIWAEQAGRMLSAAGSPPATTNWASQQACDRALGLSIWNRQFVLQAVIRRLGAPPLSTQFNNAVRLQKMRAEELSLRQEQAQPGAVQRVREEFADALQRAPTDGYLYEGLANFLEAIHDPQGALAAYCQLLELRPDDFYACLQLGRLLGEQGKPEPGEPFLEQATHLRPSLPDGWFELGTVLAAQQKFAPALECMQRAARLRPQDASYISYTAQMLAKLNRHSEAIENYRRAIQISPDSWESHFELAGELVAVNQLDEAIREYAAVLKINPRHAVSHINLGVVLVRFNRLDEAIMCFQNALKIEPDNRSAQDYLASVLAHKAQKP